MELQHTPHLGATILPHTHHRARMAHASRGAAALLLCLCAGAAQAQVYRSVGPNGHVSFSDRPSSTAATSAAGHASSGPSSSSNGAASELPYALRQTASRYPVTLYTTTDCAPCDSARRLLVQRGIPFAERSVSTEADIKALQQLSGQEQLPFATMGRQHLIGLEYGEWQRYLDLAGYPQTSALPAGWKPAPATPLTTPAPAAAPQAAPPPAAASAKPALPALPPRGITPTNPTGITF